MRLQQQFGQLGAVAVDVDFHCGVIVFPSTSCCSLRRSACIFLLVSFFSVSLQAESDSGSTVGHPSRVLEAVI